MTSWRISSKLGLPIRCLMLSLLPVKKLSTQMTYNGDSAGDSRNRWARKQEDTGGLTWSPLLTRYSHRWLPTNPAPPVTTTRLSSWRGFVLIRVLGLGEPCVHR